MDHRCVYPKTVYPEPHFKRTQEERIAFFSLVRKDIRNFLKQQVPVIRPMEEIDITKIAARYSFPWTTPEKTKALWED